jgi:hypothetical protein
MLLRLYDGTKVPNNPPTEEEVKRHQGKNKLYVENYTVIAQSRTPLHIDFVAQCALGGIVYTHEETRKYV